MRNGIQFRLKGRRALFTDPLTKAGGERYSYPVPTYEALKGVVKSVYWKPTLVWYIDRVRVMKEIRTQSMGMKPLKYAAGGNDLAMYSYLADVEYQVEAHFEWNEQRPELEGDRVEGKHFAIARRSLERGGRQDIFLGTRECQGYVEPCDFGEGDSPYEKDKAWEIAFGVMFHGFDYPDESGVDELRARFWRPIMHNGIIEFIRPEKCSMIKPLHPMKAKVFHPGRNLCGVECEVEAEGAA